MLAGPVLLENDYDVDNDPLAFHATPITLPGSGTLTLNADASFTYQPNPGFSGTDQFVYEIDDGTGRTDTATVTIRVDPSGSLLFLGTSGASAEEWDFTTTVPPPATPVPDYDSDGGPGLTLLGTLLGSEGQTDPNKFQEWTYLPATPLNLAGTLRLVLWATARDFTPNKKGHPFLYFYDCLPGGTGCTKFHEGDVHIDPWNVGPNWTFRELDLGPVTYTIAVGRELRMRMVHKHEDFWFAVTLAHPSRLIIP